MVSSKDIAEAKKLYAGFRRFNRKFLDHLYAETEGRGLFPLPLPHEAVAELYKVFRAGMWPHKAAKAVTERTRILKAVLEGEAPGVCTDDVTRLQAIADRFYQLASHDALDAYLRHRPGAPMPCGKPGRPRMDAEAEQLAKQHERKSYRQIAKERLTAAGLLPLSLSSEQKELAIIKESERIRKLLASRRAEQPREKSD